MKLKNIKNSWLSNTGFGFATAFLCSLCFLLPTPKVQAATCTPSSATICVAADDAVSIWVNGTNLGVSLYGPNWDSASAPPCVAVPIADINATGTNTLAVKNINTSTGEMWATWYLDVTCSDGTHSYTTSSDSGISMVMSTSCTDPSADGSSNAWYNSAYSSSTAGWYTPVVYSSTIWKKQIYNPKTGTG
jgi:hypothetical protein